MDEDQEEYERNMYDPFKAYFFMNEPGLEQVEFPSMSLIRRAMPSTIKGNINQTLGYRYHDKPKDPKKTVERHRIEEIERMMRESGQPKEAIERKLKQLEQIEHDRDAIAKEWRRHNEITDQHIKNQHYEQSLNRGIPQSQRIEERHKLHQGRSHYDSNRGR